ncbi:flagellar biosynthesis protein FlhF [Venenivibrio stagnispumantis]|uniref:Flagellar biosynthesis protein FlhF n=1 Tax=Venenivibrio stagnispumantis TaxID=407998 RepID=A0AA46AEN0_9AQUI|nr:GTP-binding protein [Venenivibrio stagnispumantis]MCW4572810.1 flagellar biosynthesis protein FlhF [Venenivibrio stagnispumantis]SMP13719.1 flagellar biosynthesis protein FlhF [Venenivibrio stagnispumantis]
MEINIYEGENLEKLLEQAKREFGEDVKIINYEVFTESRFLPFLKKKKYRLIVQKSEDKKEEIKEKIDFEQILNQVENLIEEKIKKINREPQIPIIETKIENNIQNLLQEFTGSAVDLIRLLTSKDVEEDVALNIVKEASGFDIDSGKYDLTSFDLKESLIKGIQNSIQFKTDFDIGADVKIITFVGPTGVGKTTNLFKIVSDLVLKKGLKISVISTDTYKVGAVAQAKTYANILNIPFFATSDSKKLKEVVEEFLEESDIIFIDTVGRSHYDYWKLGEIKETLSKVENMETFLVISANYKNNEAKEIVNKYRRYFKIDRLFFTKIDETKNHGLLLNIPIKTGIPLSFVSTGQNVPDDFKPLDADFLANLFIE